jgi:DNA-directed RNA polymerase subunit omega
MVRAKLPGGMPRQPFGIFRLFEPQGGPMARITVEDCQERVDNRFLLVQMAIKRVRQYRDGYESLVDSRNKEVVTALREIAGGKVMPDDMSYYHPITQPLELDPD